MSNFKFIKTHGVLYSLAIGMASRFCCLRCGLDGGSALIIAAYAGGGIKNPIGGAFDIPGDLPR